MNKSLRLSCLLAAACLCMGSAVASGPPDPQPAAQTNYIVSDSFTPGAAMVAVQSIKSVSPADLGGMSVLVSGGQGLGYKPAHGGYPELAKLYSGGHLRLVSPQPGYPPTVSYRRT